MVTRKIQITGIIASSGRYNRIQFEVFDKEGKAVEVVYPCGRRETDCDSLAVDSGVFTLAQAIFFATTTAADRVASAQLYLNNQCCCCTKLHVEGIYSLAPISE